MHAHQPVDGGCQTAFVYKISMHACADDGYYSCNVGMSGLPDIYTQSTRAAGPRAKGVYIRQTMSAHVTTAMYHLFIGQKPT